MSAVTALISLVPLEARAYHTDDDHVMAETAYSLRRQQWRVGLFDVAYGIHDRLTIGTGVVVWIAGGIALRAPAPNVLFKSTFFSRGITTLSLEGGFSYVPGTWNGTSVNLFLVPLAGTISIRPRPRFVTSFQLAYSWAHVRAAQPPADQSIQGAAAVDGIFGTLSLQANVSRVTALILSSRVMFKAWGPFVNGTIDLGDGATGSADGSYQIPNLNRAWNVVLSAQFSWRIVNLRLGVGYGSFFIRDPSFIVPNRSIVPDVDFFVRF